MPHVLARNLDWPSILNIFISEWASCAYATHKMPETSLEPRALLKPPRNLAEPLCNLGQVLLLGHGKGELSIPSSDEALLQQTNHGAGDWEGHLT